MVPSSLMAGLMFGPVSASAPPVATLTRVVVALFRS